MNWSGIFAAGQLFHLALKRSSGLEVKAQGWESGALDSGLSSAIDLLCDLKGKIFKNIYMTLEPKSHFQK